MKTRIQSVIGALSVYYLTFAAVCLWWPTTLLRLFPSAAATPPWLLSLVGVMVGCIGIGLILPCIAPLTHWGILLVVLLGQIALPLCTLTLMWQGDVPILAGSLMALGDIIWIPLLGLCLSWIAELHASEPPPAANVEQSLWDIRPQGSPETLGELSEKQQILVVVLRHLGCTFCRETLAALHARMSELTAAGTKVLVVSMSDPEAMAQIHTRYNLPNVLLLSDPERVVYRALQIPKGRLTQVLGATVWKAGLLQGKLFTYGIGSIQGDPFQLSGSALIHNRKVVWRNVTNSAADSVQLTESCAL